MKPEFETHFEPGVTIQANRELMAITNPEPNFKSTDEVLKELGRSSTVPPGVPIKILDSKVFRLNRWYKTDRGWINSLALAGAIVREL